MIRTVRGTVTVLAIATLIACNDGGGRDVTPSQRRMFSQRTAGTLQVSDVTRPELVERQVLSCGRLLAGWNLHRIRIDGPCADDAPAELASTGPDPQMTTGAGFDSSRVQTIEVDGDHLGPGVSLFWAGPGQAFSADRQMALAAFSNTLRFEVAEHPAWRGHIERIRFDPTPGADHRFQVDEIRLLRHIPDSERLQEAAAHSWRVTLGGETHPAAIMPKDRKLSWHAMAGPGDRLVFTTARLGGRGAQPEVAVVMAPDTGNPIRLSRPARSAPENGAGWMQHEIALPLQKTSPVRFDFELADDAPSSTPELPALIGSVRVVGSRPARDKLNIVLISIDTLRADHLSVYGYERPTSPRIDAWARERAVVCDTAVASAPWTLPSHVSMLSGLDPIRHGANYEIPQHPWPSTVRTLANRGYETIAYTGGAFLDPSFGFDEGFDSYVSWPAGHDNSRELEVHTSRFVEWLESRPPAPFFAFFHTYEAHAPFRPRQPFFADWCEPEHAAFEGSVVITDGGGDEAAGYTAVKYFDLLIPGEAPHRLSDDEMQLVTDLYDAGIAYTDRQIGRIFDALAQTGLDDSTAVIITSDHGQALGEKGLMGHAYLYDFNLVVPMIIGHPEATRNGSRAAVQARLVDVAPTILDLAGVAPPPNIDGVSLVPLLFDDDTDLPGEAWSYAAKTNYGIGVRLAEGVKYIYNNTAWTPANGREELYDLNRDPDELVNRAADSAETEELRGRVAQHLNERRTGLRIRIANHDNVSWHGRLDLGRDQVLLLTKVKGRGVPTGGVTKESDRALALAAPPSAEFELVLEDLRCSRVHFVGAADDSMAGALDHELDLNELHGRKWLSRVDGEWSWSSEPMGNGDVVLQIERIGDITEPPGDDPTLDPDLVEQLRALGYAQ